MKIQNPQTKEKLIQRLHRVAGQVRGVETMLEEERDCQEILQQLSAIRAAVQSASRIFLQEYATACLMDIDDTGTQTSPGGAVDAASAETNRQLRRSQREKMVQEMIALLDKAP